MLRGHCFAQISNRRAASSGEGFLIVDGEIVQVVAECIHAATLPKGKILSIPSGHLRDALPTYTLRVPDTLKFIRHERWLELLRTRKASELAKLLGVDANYLSRVKKGPKAKDGKAIGEGNARLWEKKLGLPQYWFDGPNGGPAPEKQALYHGIALTRAGALLAAEWEKLDLADRIEVETMILERVAKQKRTQRGKDDKTKPVN